MKRINRFELDLQAAAEAPESTSTPLLLDGRPTGQHIEGLWLVDQFETEGGYLLVTDHDDPWEEMTVVTLLDTKLNRLSSKLLGVFIYVFPSRTFNVTRIDVDGRALVLQGSGPEEGRYRVEIRRWPVWLGGRARLRADWLPG